MNFSAVRACAARGRRGALGRGTRGFANWSKHQFAQQVILRSITVKAAYVSIELAYVSIRGAGGAARCSQSC